MNVDHYINMETVRYVSLEENYYWQMLDPNDKIVQEAKQAKGKSIEEINKYIYEVGIDDPVQFRAKYFASDALFRARNKMNYYSRQITKIDDDLNYKVNRVASSNAYFPYLDAAYIRTHNFHYGQLYQREGTFLYHTIQRRWVPESEHHIFSSLQANASVRASEVAFFFCASCKRTKISHAIDNRVESYDCDACQRIICFACGAQSPKRCCGWCRYEFSHGIRMKPKKVVIKPKKKELQLVEYHRDEWKT